MDGSLLIAVAGLCAGVMGCIFGHWGLRADQRRLSEILGDAEYSKIQRGWTKRHLK